MSMQLRSLSFFQQTIVLLAYYFIHVTYLSQTAITLPFELFPTHIRNIGLDSLAGILCIVVPHTHNRLNREKQDVHGKMNGKGEGDGEEQLLGINLSIDQLIHPNRVPWRRPRQHPLRSAALIFLLFVMYLASGMLSPAIVTLLNIVAVFVPLTVPIQR